eukprot:SAG31_NODE_2218_length_6159_cov_3.265182_2_plen_99_part_00
MSMTIRLNPSCSHRLLFTIFALTRLADYLSYMSSVNQLLHMAKQLREDVLGGKTHKYMAHQVALLYVSMRSPASKRLVFARRSRLIWLTSATAMPKLH